MVEVPQPPCQQMGGGSVIPSSWRNDGYGNYQTEIEATENILTPTFQDKFTAGLNFGTYSKDGKRYLSVRGEKLTKRDAYFIKTIGSQIAERDKLNISYNQEIQSIEKRLYSSKENLWKSDKDVMTRRISILEDRISQNNRAIEKLKKDINI